MKAVINDIVDADKIQDTLEVKWEHEKINDECFGEFQTITFENTFIFKLLESNILSVSLCFISDMSSEVVIFVTYEKKEASIRFRDITRVLYNPKLKLIIFESKNNTHYSELSIDSRGKFELSISNPLSNYSNSWLTVMAENLGLIEFRHP